MPGRRAQPIATGKARLAERLKAQALAASGPAIDELSIACVGAGHANPRRKGRPTGNRETEIIFAAPGDPVILEPEPTNQHDQNAVSIYSKDGVQMGYVSADRAVFIREAWDEKRPVKAIFQKRTPWGAWIRVSFDGNDPSIPLEEEADALPVPDGLPEGADYDPGFGGVDWVPPDD